jgi:hypothetical protein
MIAKGHAQTGLQLFRFEGNRAIIFDIADRVPKKELKACLRMALCYHRNKIATS